MGLFAQLAARLRGRREPEGIEEEGAEAPAGADLPAPGDPSSVRLDAARSRLKAAIPPPEDDDPS